MNERISPIGLSALVLGLILTIKLFGGIDASLNAVFGNMLLFFGIVSVFFSISRKNRGGIFIGVLSFMIGTLVFVINNYDIMLTNKLILPSLFFILSAPFLFLFFNDLTQKIFLYIFFFLFFSGIASIIFYSQFEWIRFSASISRTVINLWPYLLIIIGIGVLTDRRIR